MQKATYNFTTLIGQGAYGPVYKAQMPAGETVAVKVLANDSKQGEKEFQTEVTLVADYLTSLCFLDCPAQHGNMKNLERYMYYLLRF